MANANNSRLIEVQRRFAAYIRNPGAHPPPADVSAQRMAMYRELFYNNVESFLSGNFPVLRSLHSDATWHALAEDFFARHRCRTPYFYAIPEEFLAYLRDERSEQPGDLPFMQELAHYEWVEMAAAIAQGSPPNAEAPAESALEQRWMLSELAWPLAYRWPVQQISPEYQPQQPPAEATLLVVYRNRADRVKFLEINPVCYRLLELIQSQPGKTGAVYLKQIADELNHPDTEVVLRSGAEILLDLQERAVIGYFR